MIKTKKAATLLLTALVAGNMLLCSCDKTTETTQTSEEVTTTTTEATTTTEETTTETTETTIPNGRDTTPYKPLVLDGDGSHHFITTDYCYIESSKYVLFLDKDVDIPGDFTANLDMAIDEIENQLQLPYAPAGFDGGVISDTTAYYGINPWENWQIGPKIAIFVAIDREDAGYGSSVYNTDVVLRMYEFYSKDFWNSVPSYKKNPGRKRSYTPYDEITGLLAECIALRNCKNEIPGIMSLGIGDHLSRTVIDSLASKNSAFAQVKKKRYLYDSPIPQVITEKNAEKVFANDYFDSKTEYKNAMAQRTYGRYFCKFLLATYGKDAYKKFIEDSNTYGEGGNYAGIVKASTGDQDVFKKFGKWCKKNKALQKKNGVYK